jgi:hypothetical protein
VRVSSVLFAVVALVLVISLVCIWFYPSIEDFMASNTMWNGIRDFSLEFNADNIDSLDDLPEIPEEAVLVSIPYLEYRDTELSAIKRFIEDGGTLLLMDDYGYGNGILSYLGLDARFSNRPLLDPLFCYRNQFMPRVTDFSPELREDGIAVLMLNNATALTSVAGSAVIAWSSSASFLDIDESGAREEGEATGPFAVAAEYSLGRGKLVLVADPSIIINTMVGRDDNYAFIAYLCRGEGGPKRVLIDRSHLTETPLDVSKSRLSQAREVMASPPALLGITAMIFVVVSRYTLRKGESIV